MTRKFPGFVLIALSLPVLATAQSPSATINVRPKSLAPASRAVPEVRALAPRLSHEELVGLASRLRQVVGSHSLAKHGAAPPSALVQAVREGRLLPFDLATAKRTAPDDGGIRVHWHEHNGTPTFISGAGLRAGLGRTVAAASPAALARSYISANRNWFRLEDPEQELRVIEEHVDQLGKMHVVFAQHYQGIPLWGQQLVAHVESTGELYALSARYSPTPRQVQASAPRLTAAEAVAIATADLSERTEIAPLAAWARKLLNYEAPVATLYIWINAATQQPHLIWHVQIRPNLQDNWCYFVDAHSGALLERYNATKFDGPHTATATDLNGNTQTVHSYQVGPTYYMIDASRSMWQANQPAILDDPRGALWTIDLRNQELNDQAQLFHVMSANNTWNDRASVSAHSNMGYLYEYFRNTHGRNSIDGNGGTVISIIHIAQNGKGMDNAFWGGAFMGYGDGDIRFKPLAGGLDAAAHEMTHGIIEHTVKLEYKFQSGALDESLADVFGVMVDREDWRVGEDIVQSSYYPSGALRDMQNPHNGGNAYGDRGWQPAHMNEFQNLNLETDNGGVHVNSGIPNRACYLIATALGREKTEKIYYRVLEARYLNTQSNFVDMRLAAVQAAADLFGGNSPEVNAVKAGFDGAGIVGSEGTPPPSDIPPVEGQEWIAAIAGEQTDHSLYLLKPVIQSNADLVQLTGTQVSIRTGNPLAVTDDGKFILFVDLDGNIRAIGTDRSGETVIIDTGGWSSISLSPDGSKLAATRTVVDTTIYVINLDDPSASQAVHLYTPTTGEGSTANVTMFADALDWDRTSSLILYDAYNRVPQGNSQALEYWDVNLLDIHSGVIVRLFPPQREGVSIANPAFAQTNDGFLVFDYIDFKAGTDQIMGANLFNHELGIIEDNGNSIGYPRFSPNDGRLVFQRFVNNVPTLRQIPVAASRIHPAGPSEPYVNGGLLPTWFAIGSRPSGVQEGSPAIPQGFVLEQNHPNPFNPETTVRYTLPFEARVILTIYDASGRQVATLEDARRNTGEHRLIWNGRDASGRALASGIYFYKLQAQTTAGHSFSLTRKMTLIR